MKSLYKKEKYFVTLVLSCIVSLMPGGVMCAPPPGAGSGQGGQQICQSGPCVDSTAIIDGQVNTQDLANGAVGAAQMQDNSISGVKVLDGSLTGADVQDGSIGSADIAAGAVGTGQLSDGAVTGLKVQAGSISGAHIQDGGVGSADIAPGAVGTGQLGDGSVTGQKVQAGSLTGAHIQDGSVGPADIAAGSVATDHLGNDAVTGAKVLDGSLTGADIAAGAVGAANLADGAVTGAKVQAGSLTGAHMQDGSVDSTKVGFNFAGSNSKGGPALDLTCVGCVSKSELDFAIPGSAARRIVVAASGGDFTSIQAAINSVNPTADNPYIIKVMPGTYVENVRLKSYISLEGAGREVTTIQAPSTSSDVVTLMRVNNVAISGFAIQGGDRGVLNYYTTAPITIRDNTFTNNDHDIYNYTAVALITGNRIIHNSSNYWSMYSRGINVVSSSDVVIQGNIIAGNNLGNAGYGIYTNTSSAIINGNIISGFDVGIFNYSASPTITANSITSNGLGNTSNYKVGILNLWRSSPMLNGNTISGNAIGISNATSSPTIIGNSITGNNAYGVNVSTSTPVIINNRITGNGGGAYQDIFVAADSAPNISFNVYDTITGTTGVGMYNVNSNGDPAPAP